MTKTQKKQKQINVHIQKKVTNEAKTKKEMYITKGREYSEK